jgi:predicted SprT family Zn-dependent metalloprotease
MAIELSVKVLDSLERLIKTLLHEMCHLAAAYIDNVNSPPHGKTFYKYANAIIAKYPFVEITTYHDYDIHYKYQYICTGAGCGKEFGRHSKVKNMEEIRCRHCHSSFEFKGSFNPDGTPIKQRQTSQYTRFQQEYSREIGVNFPKIKGAQLLAIVAQEYRVYLQAPEEYYPGISQIGTA